MAANFSSRLAFTVLCLGLPMLCAANQGSSFRGGSVRGTVDRTVTMEEVEASLQESLGALLRGGSGAAAQRVSAIEASLWSSFQALPKNEAGRLAPRAVRYLVHSYFAREHGWLIKGLEPHGMQQEVTEVHEVNILQDKAPALVEALLEARRADRGLSLSDTVVMVAALERLIFDESVALLEAAYSLNGLSAAEPLQEAALHEVLSSYLLIFEMGVRGNLTDVRGHRLLKERAARAGGNWPTLVEFEQDAALNFDFARRHNSNPFVAPLYSFQAASQIVEGLAQSYGKWQNTECRQMKEDLMQLDPDGSGRVPLGAFYSQPDNSDYQFTESVEYLRKIGALDESSAGAPRVRIANYLAGPSNCIASSTYYSVCCLSECDALVHELEGKLGAPTASAKQLLGLVSNLSSSTVDAPRQLPEDLAAKLEGIAKRHGGEVPLHGRLFAQWLHLAFPNECPYPHVAEDAAALTPSHWLDKSATAPAEERQRHVQAAKDATSSADSLALAEVAAVAAAPWSDHEVLPLQEPQGRGRSAVAGAVRLVMQLAMLLGLLRVAITGWRTASNAAAGKVGADPSKKGKSSAGLYELPF